LAGGLLGSVATLAVTHWRGLDGGAEGKPTGVLAPTATLSGISTPPHPAGTAEAKAASPEFERPEVPKLPAALGSAASDMPAEPATPSKPDVTRVTVEVLPPRAKVTFPGGSWTGPIGEVEVPRGQQVTLQIARPGYVPRRLVLDGSKRKVIVGLVKKPRAPTGVLE
jgi:hypothetical protein